MDDLLRVAERVWSFLSRIYIDGSGDADGDGLQVSLRARGSQG